MPTGMAGCAFPPVTVAGAVPPALAHAFQSMPVPALPEMARLPKPRTRCPISGCSRTWLIETDASLPPAERFLFRVRQRGKVRGAVFINVPKLLGFLRAQATADAFNTEVNHG